MDPGDLHEALISKGQVLGNENINLIYSRYNCVERHHASQGCVHAGGIGGDEAFGKAARYLAQWESEDSVRRWLEEMKVVFPQVGKDALRRFNSIFKKEK